MSHVIITPTLQRNFSVENNFADLNYGSLRTPHTPESYYAGYKLWKNLDCRIAFFVIG
jgi:hypothetical protein